MFNNYFKHSIPEEDRVEVLKHCGHCTSELILEGREELVEQAVGAPPSEADPVPKRPRSVRECLQELKDLKELLDAGALSPGEFESLKTKLLSEVEVADSLLHLLGLFDIHNTHTIRVTVHPSLLIRVTVNPTPLRVTVDPTLLQC